MAYRNLWYQALPVVTFLGVLSDFFRGEQRPPFGRSKGHWEEAGKVIFCFLPWEITLKPLFGGI